MSDPQRNRQNEKWHITKSLNLGHLSTTLALVFGALVFFSNLNTRVSVIEDRDRSRQESFKEMRLDIKEIKTLLWEMNSRSNE